MLVTDQFTISVTEKIEYFDFGSGFDRYLTNSNYLIMVSRYLWKFELFDYEFECICAENSLVLKQKHQFSKPKPNILTI